MTRLGLRCVWFFDSYQGPPPTYAEIALGIGTSKQVAARVVTRLIRRGILERSGSRMKRTHGIRGLKLHVHQQTSP